MATSKIAGREVKSVGFGGMVLDEYEPKPNNEECIALLKSVAQSDIGLIDTADVYGVGRNETMIGKALTAEEKKKIIIATKAGCTRPGGIEWDVDGRPEHIKKAIKESLNRLGVEKIWLYQLHAPDHKVPFVDSLNAFKELQNQGLIEHIGVSNFSLQQLKQAQEIVEIVSVENHFNLVFKQDEHELLPYLLEQNIAFFPYFPLGGGKILQNSGLVDIAKGLNFTTSQLALAWIINKWPMAIPIPGTSKKEHLLENNKAADIKLDKEIIEKLDGLF